jgi:protein TonB
MPTGGRSEVYSLAELARAAGVNDAEVRALAGDDRLLSAHDALRLGRELVAHRRAVSLTARAPLFASMTQPASLSLRRLPIALSGSLHVVLLAAIVFLFGFRTSAATSAGDEVAGPMHLVFLATPGPGGGGGGGGLRQKIPPPKAESEGRSAVASPAPAPPEQKARLLAAEPLPSIIAPVISAPDDVRTRSGLLEQVTPRPDDNDSRGSGRAGGAGSGSGTGIGEGNGSGIGPGAGGGIGGGPYRPGSGITPPRVLREVKADYSEDARRRGVTGDVVLEIVVRRDGSVGDVTLLQGLGLGLDDRAIAAVRQWRFAPAERLGVPVDVIVEVGVEFKLR